MEENPLSSDTPQSKLVPESKPSPLTPSEMAEAVAPPGNQASAPPVFPSDSASLDEAAKTEFLWNTHQYLGDYARFGDTKAAFAGTLAAAILGGMYSAKAHLALLRVPIDEWAAAAWLIAIDGTFLIAAIVLAVWTIIPSSPCLKAFRVSRRTIVRQ